jgi:hypothetical protein
MAKSQIDTKRDHFLVSFDRQIADVRLISQIGSTTPVPGEAQPNFEQHCYGRAPVSCR